MSTVVSVRTILPGIATCLLLCSPAWSQYHPIRFDHITTKDGLTQDIVTGIVEDSKGFMWFGTEDGLNRYDGYSICTYKHDPLDSTTISGNSITAMLVDKRGKFWVASGGLDAHDERTDRFIRYRHSPTDPFSVPAGHINALCEDSSGSVWAASDGGLGRLDLQTGRWTQFRHEPDNTSSVRSDIVLSVVTDRDGSLWVGTDKGLDRYDVTANGFKHFFMPEGAAEETGRNAILSVVEGQDRIIWLGTNGGGLIRLDPRTGRMKRYPIEFQSRRAPGDKIIFAISSDIRGRLWIGHFAGLDIFNPLTETFDHYRQTPDDPDAIVGDRVYAMCADSKGAMWLGTYHGGIDRYDPHRHKFSLIRSFRVSATSSDGNILALLENSKKDVWIGTQTGLAVVRPVLGIEGTELQPIPVAASFATGMITALFEDSRRTVWVGHDKPGIVDGIDSRGNVVARYPYQGVRAIAEDRSGNLWFGTREDGLVRRSPRDGTLTWYGNRPENPDSLWGDGVWCLFADRAGSVWAGLSGPHGCLNRFDPAKGKFHHFVYDPVDSNSVPASDVRSIYEDSSGAFWFGFWGAGLTKYEPSVNRFTRYFEQDGLPSNYVKAILGDDRNMLWISTERGISRFDPSTGKFRNYTVDDGLQGDRFYSGSALRSRNGTMYFGGDHGLNIFHPDSVRDDEIPPVVRLTGFKVFDKPVDLPDAVWNLREIELSYRQDFLSFDYVALDYSAPKRNRYAYMLEGFDRSWVDAGDRRYAAYTHLDGGTYTFRVRGANGDGVWNNEGAAIRIVIDPPFWETFWFRFLAALTVAGVIYTAYRIRLSRILAVERLRQRIAQDLHDEVGTNLSTIAMASQSLARGRGSGKQATEALERIGTVAQQTTDQMKDIVWILKTSNESLDSIVAKMREVASQLLGGIRYTFDTPAEGLPEKVDLEFKRNVFLFYKECLNNVAKHSGATEVKIRLQYSGGLFQLQIDDNGKGFAEKSVSPGSGLQNLRERGKQIRGSVTIDSGPGRGTHISLAVKTTQMRHSIRGNGGVR